jgi:hypothetical protein
MLLLALYVGWDYWRLNHPPEITLETEHYVIYSTATKQQTVEVGEIAEMLYAAYVSKFGGIPSFEKNRPKLKLKLFKDQNEFKRHNKSSDWAEACYQEPYCYQYYSQGEKNPYHWMIHEATHQLNNEVAHLKIPRWMDEGLATYFGSSIINGGRLQLGQVDPNAYPIWWLAGISLSGDIVKDIKGKKIIPLSMLIGGEDNAAFDKHFNKYYIHWWSLTHFLFHYGEGRYSNKYLELIMEGGSPESFKKKFGSLDEIQNEWYNYFQQKISELKKP